MNNYSREKSFFLPFSYKKETAGFSRPEGRFTPEETYFLLQLLQHFYCRRRLGVEIPAAGFY